MLVEFRIENHRSIRDEHALTLEAAHPAGDDDARARRVSGHTEPLLTSAALYGANASGKSNVLEALAFMQEAVLYSHRTWEPEGGVPNDPFAWGPAATAGSLYEITFVADGIRYRYGFVVDSKRFVEEWLHAFPHGRQQTWLERDGDEFKYGDHLKGENKLVQQVTRPNALFLSAAVQHRHEQLSPIYHWFRKLALVNTHRSRLQFSHPRAIWWLSAKRTVQQSLVPAVATDAHEVYETYGAYEEYEAVMNVIRAADLGIVDVKIDQPADDAGGPRSRRRPTRFLVRHQHTEHEAWLPLEQESHGTQKLFNLAPHVVHALRVGAVLAIDELEAGMHPLLAAHIVRLFHDPVTNPHHAQLIFTTHDTNLLGTTLGEPLLRRDQIWLTEKDPEGATSLRPLSDYKPRKSENLERGYLQGRYGAIPFLGDFVVTPEQA